MPDTQHYPTWDADRHLWQALTNRRPIPPRDLQRQDREPVEVTVTLRWERDGPEGLDTVAVDWVGQAVLVRIRDRRLHVPWAWIDAADVRRR